MRDIYLDNGATTKPSAGVVEKMTQAMEEAYGNPSSLHRKGQQAERLLTAARGILGEYLRVDPGTLFFTSGGTESINTALWAAVKKGERLGRHILTARGEHPATTETLKAIEALGYEVEYLDLDDTGRIRPESLRDKLRPETVLVTCLHVNNETGVIQPVEEMGTILREAGSRALFHVDAVQSFAKLPLYPEKWHIDLLSASAHKFHGPKGVGCLYVRRGLGISPFIRGGGQERKTRSGTENVPGIAGMGQAAREAVSDLEGHGRYVQGLKEYLWERIYKEIPEVSVNGPAPEKSAPHVLNIRFPGIRSEVLLHSLEDYGIFISSGSACSSNKPEEKSPALSALGLSRGEMDESARFSFCVYNTREEMDETVEALKKIIPMLRRLRPRG